MQSLIIPNNFQHHHGILLICSYYVLLNNKNHETAHWLDEILEPLIIFRVGQDHEQYSFIDMYNIIISWILLYHIYYAC